MIYTPLTKKALQLAFNAHKGQADKGGMPYILHPVHLAEQMKDEITVCTALLHDVIEDTSITFEALEKEGFYPEIIEALKLLTHDDGISYMDYIAEIRKNPVAREVKLADLMHNSDLSRLDNPDEKDIMRRNKYMCAIKLLM